MLESYRLRLRRRRALIRAWRKHFGLSAVSDNTGRIKPDDVLVFATLRNEAARLPYFLQYYRDLGVSHFLMVDNCSDDGGKEFLEDQPDVSVWAAEASYKAARFGMDWMNWLLRKYGHGHWTLTVDLDEFFVFPYCDSRPLQALTEWLEQHNISSMGTMLLDMYPKGQVDINPYEAGQNPLEIAKWFDAGNYVIEKNPFYKNLWIQGGPRARAFFSNNPEKAPALNKIPLVKWSRRYAYVSSTHILLPRSLNLTYDDQGGEKTSGVLLHTKFLDSFAEKAREEMRRRQHYLSGIEYKAYSDNLQDPPDLWCNWSEKYINWRQLEILGLMSKGNWA